MIQEVKKFREFDKGFLYENLSKDFNRISKKKKSKYKIEIINEFPKLTKPFFLNFGDSLGEIDIYYDENLGNFKFVNGIDFETFKKIEDILKDVKQCFIIETS